MLSCEASGNPLPVFIWYKSGTSITEGVTSTILPSSVQSNLTIPNAQFSDEGDYVCVASNMVGSPPQTITVNNTITLILSGGM